MGIELCILVVRLALRILLYASKMLRMPFLRLYAPRDKNSIYDGIVAVGSQKQSDFSYWCVRRAGMECIYQTYLYCYI